MRLALLLTLTACQVERLVVPPLPEDAGKASCASAAEHIASLPGECDLMSKGPDEVAGTEDDQTFLEICERLQADPDTRGLLDLVCVTNAQSCKAVNECGGEL